MNLLLGLEIIIAALCIGAGSALLLRAEANKPWEFEANAAGFGGVVVGAIVAAVIVLQVFAF